MFPCTKCGCCCKRGQDGLDLLLKNGIKFPYKMKANGECEMLENNKCKVYETRPDICNIDSMARITKIPKKHFYKQNAIACNKMMDEDNIPK